jgi:hypothetical protein
MKTRPRSSITRRKAQLILGNFTVGSTAVCLFCYVEYSNQGLLKYFVTFIEHMNVKSILGVIMGVTLVTTLATTTLLQQVYAWTDPNPSPRKAPPAISGENVYVAWWTNNTANSSNEVIFRASTDGGATFGDKINLSNTTDTDSTRAEIDSDADSVVVTWWETNQTSDTPVMRVSTDNGASFGSVLTLATNGTLGEVAEEEQ